MHPLVSRLALSFYLFLLENKVAISCMAGSYSILWKYFWTKTGLTNSNQEGERSHSSFLGLTRSHLTAALCTCLPRVVCVCECVNGCYSVCLRGNGVGGVHRHLVVLSVTSLNWCIEHTSWIFISRAHGFHSMNVRVCVCVCVCVRTHGEVS